MKSYYLAGVILFTLFANLSAKGWNAILSEPKHSQGYLIMKGDIPNVDYWILSIYKREYDQNENYTDTRIERINIIGKNYYKMPDAYKIDKFEYEYVYDIEGWSRSPKSKVVSDDKVAMYGDGDAWVEGDRYVCNGPTYAWTIVENIGPNGGFFYELHGATDGEFLPGLKKPFYENMTLTNYALYIQNTPTYWPYYNLDANTNYIAHSLVQLSNGTLPKVYVKREAPSSYPQLKNYDGQILPSHLDIVGVNKALGPWGGSNIIRTGTLANNWDGLNKDGIISRFNQDSNLSTYFQTPLACASTDWSVNGEDDDDHGWDNDCSESWSPTDFGSWKDCLDEYYGYTPTSTDIVIVNWDNGVYEEHSIFSRDDLTDRNGNPTSPNVSLSPGLYSLHNTNDEGVIASVFFEVTTTTSFNIPTSSYLDVNIFPVPITANKFQVTLAADAKLRTVYEIYDLNGNRLHQEIFDMAKDAEETFEINPSLPLPTGILVNKFLFTDGSVKTIQTVKQ